MNASRPKVSFLMAVFNGEDYLAEALDSILGQTFSDFEAVIVDDGSTDRTSEILQKFEDKDARVRIFRQENQGLTRALNTGIHHCHGEWIARHDADDVSHPNRLEKLLERATGKSLLVSGWDRIDSEEKRASVTSLIMARIPSGALPYFSRYGNFFVHGSYFFRKEDILRIGGYREKFRFAQDYDLFLRALETFDVEFVPEPLYSLRTHSTSITSRKRREQLIFGFIAGLFRLERGKAGHDSYALLDENKPDELFSRLRQVYRGYSSTMEALLFARRTGHRLIHRRPF